MASLDTALPSLQTVLSILECTGPLHLAPAPHLISRADSVCAAINASTPTTVGLVKHVQNNKMGPNPTQQDLGWVAYK